MSLNRSKSFVSRGNPLEPQRRTPQILSREQKSAPITWEVCVLSRRPENRTQMKPPYRLTGTVRKPEGCEIPLAVEKQLCVPLLPLV